MRTRALIAIVALLAGGVTEARTANRTRPTRANVSVSSLRAALAAHVWGSGAIEADSIAGKEPAPAPSPALRAVLPPEVLAALVERVATAEATASVEARPAIDGLSSRELRREDERRTRILPLAVGRF